MLTALFDEYEQRQIELNRAADANRDLLPAYYAAERFAEEVNDQRLATEDMIRTMPAKSLAQHLFCWRRFPACVGSSPCYLRTDHFRCNDYG